MNPVSIIRFVSMLVALMSGTFLVVDWLYRRFVPVSTRMVPYVLAHLLSQGLLVYLLVQGVIVIYR